MKSQVKTPRVLVASPEVTFVPHAMGPGARSICARAGGFGDICSAQILEDEIILPYCKIGDDGFPQAWVRIMTKAMRSIGGAVLRPADGGGVCLNTTM